MTIMLSLVTLSLVAGPQTAGRTPMPAQTAPAPASAATPPAVGATVYDPSGAAAATVDSIAGSNIVLSTGTNKVTLAMASIGTSPKGPTIGLTRAGLDAAAEKAKVDAAAQLKAQLVPGATVRGPSGNDVVGTVKEADAQFVTLTTARGDVKIPVAGVASSPGGLVIGMTADQLNAAASGVK